MRILAILGAVLVLIILGGAGYAYFGFYNIAATEPHMGYVASSFHATMHASVERHAAQEVDRVPPLDDAEMVRTGGTHFRAEGCVSCHGGPGTDPAEFALHMRPDPPPLSRQVSAWSDTELFWIMKHGIKMSGMPAFGPTHDDDTLWAMVAFVRRLPEMSPAEFTALTEGGTHGEPSDGSDEGAQ